MNPCPPRPSSLDAQALPSGFFRQKPQFSVTCSVRGAVLMWPLVALLVAFSLEFQGFVPIAVARVCIQDHMQGRRGFFPPPFPTAGFWVILGHLWVKLVLMRHRASFTSRLLPGAQKRAE